jgi:hypothetical protein
VGQVRLGRRSINLGLSVENIHVKRQRSGMVCCSSKLDSRFLRSIGARACEPSGAALKYCTGHEIACPSSRAARNGQYGSRKNSRAMTTASACPVIRHDRRSEYAASRFGIVWLSIRCPSPRQVDAMEFAAILRQELDWATDRLAQFRHCNHPAELKKTTNSG